MLARTMFRRIGALGIEMIRNIGVMLQVLFCIGKQVASPGKIAVRLHNHPESLLALKLLKASCIGNLFLLVTTLWSHNTSISMVYENYVGY